MIKRIIISVIIMTALIIGGCRMSMPFMEEEEPESMELTDQQKQILSKEGLPHDYSKLDYRYKEYLRITDKMMTYINEKYKKYDVHFTYLAYHAPELLDGGSRILVIPDGYDPSIDVVTVKVKSGIFGGYEDDYLEFVTRAVYEEVLTDYFAKIIPRDKFRVYVSSVTLKDKVSPDDIPMIDKDFILDTHLSSGTFIYISEAVCEPGDEFVEFTKEYFKWLQDNQFDGWQDLYLYMDEGIQHLTPQEHASTRGDYAIESTFGNNYNEDKIYNLERDTLDYLKVEREE